MAERDQKMGTLFMIPTTLGNNNPLEVLPISIKQTIENVNYYIVENEKSARHFIKSISPRKSQQDLNLSVLNKYTEAAAIPTFLIPCFEGNDVGILSEAGCPGIADPGADVAKYAHEKGIRVVPLVGPSSITMALMASGMNGQRFAFNGYLPIENSERRLSLKKIEKLSKDFDQSQIFIETPYRNDKLLAELLKILSEKTLICIACDITLPTEYIATKTVREWRNIPLDLHKRPTIFIIQA